ncbi:MAG: membrane protein insertase YidC [Chloroflexi bacterium]|nr:membrane protein insertase YidC [Chloroflexota bacterium]
MSSTESKPEMPSLPQFKLDAKFFKWVAIITLAVFLLNMKSLGEWWNLLFFEPMLNSLLLIYRYLGHSFALSILVFTVLIKLLTLPMTRKQMETTKKTQEMQPRLEELKKKYGNDQERMSQEQVKLMRELGISPTGCIGPMLIQFPIWIGLYNSVLRILSNNPAQLFELGKHVYPFLPQLSKLVPFQSRFLWLDLALPDPYYVMPILVAALMWAQQKMMASPTADAQQQQMNQSMGLMMPLMFGFFMYSAPSGVALYFVISNILSIVQQYFTTGWGGLLPKKASANAGAARNNASPASNSKGKSDGSKSQKKHSG